MPFNSALPANNSPISSAELRSQFNAIQEQVTSHEDSINNLASDLSAGINSTANNCEGVDPLGNITISNPPTQAQVTLLRQKIDELILALRRT